MGDVVDEITGILFVGTTSSHCGVCGRNADPNETHHVMEHMVGEGCGARFVSIGSSYRGVEGLKERVQAMRPDLDWVSQAW